MALYAWAFDERASKAKILFPLLVLAASNREFSYTNIALFPAALLLPFLFLLGRIREIHWTEVLAAALLGGLLSWKAADAWPLLTGLTGLCAALLLLPGALLCREREDRLLVCALGGIIFELFFCLRESLLFSYCVLRLGSRAGLDLSAASICLWYVLEQVRGPVFHREERSLSMRI